MRNFIFICILFLPTLAISQARRAQSLIEKGKHHEAHKLLIKTLTKDSLALAEKYVLAQLFFEKENPKDDLDSAHYYILKAIDSYVYYSFKEQNKLLNSGFGLPSLVTLKEQIDKAGFLRAKNNDNEQDYIDYLAKFSNSIYTDSAISLRNKAAFLLAQKANTYQSYKIFIDTYTEAEELQDAKKHYERLLYEEKTKDKKLHSYQQFLKNYPATWHRNDVEQWIYDIITSRNTLAGYEDFIHQYPQSFLNDQAKFAQYLMLDDEGRKEFLAQGNLTAPQRDSINSMRALQKQLVIPTIHNNKFQIINSSGKAILDSLTWISDQYRCSSQVSDFLLTTIEDENALINLAGTVLAKGDIMSYQDQGKGILKLVTATDVFFIHAAGFRTNPHYFKEAHLTGAFIAFREKAKWGLESISGIAIIQTKYDSIYSFHNQIIIGKGKKWGIYPASHFYPTLDGEKVDIRFPYDQLTMLSNEYLLLETGKKSALMNEDGEIIVPMEEQIIELVDSGYFIDRIDSVFDSRASNTWYNNISHNANWIIGDRGDVKDVYFNHKLVFNASNVQSVGNLAARISFADSTFCYFNDSTRIPLSEDDLMLPVSKLGEHNITESYIHTNAKEKQKVYNQQGELLDIGKFDKLVDLGNGYLLSRVKNNYKLLTDSGKVVLESIDAALSLNNNYISYLRDGKFGLFRAIDSTLVEAKYDRPLLTYADTLFIAVGKGMHGIIDNNDSLLVPFQYDEIRYLNDSIAILKKNFRWIFWDIHHSRPLLDNISDYWIIGEESQQVFKIFKGVGYGIWTATHGLILNSTYSDINIVMKGEEVVYIAEKRVDEADLVIMLYYNKEGNLFRKEVLSTAQYEELTCKKDKE